MHTTNEPPLTFAEERARSRQRSAAALGAGRASLRARIALAALPSGANHQRIRDQVALDFPRLSAAEQEDVVQAALRYQEDRGRRIPVETLQGASALANPRTPALASPTDERITSGRCLTPEAAQQPTDQTAPPAPVEADAGHGKPSFPRVRPVSQTSPRIHVLPVEAFVFDLILNGKRSHLDWDPTLEIVEGDALLLREWNPARGGYTGRRVMAARVLPLIPEPHASARRLDLPRQALVACHE